MLELDFIGTVIYLRFINMAQVEVHPTFGVVVAETAFWEWRLGQPPQAP